MKKKKTPEQIEKLRKAGIASGIAKRGRIAESGRGAFVAVAIPQSLLDDIDALAKPGLGHGRGKTEARWMVIRRFIPKPKKKA